MTAISLSSRFMASAAQDEVRSSRYPLTLELKSNLKRSVRAAGGGQRSGSLQLPLSPCSLACSLGPFSLARSHSVRSHDDRILAPSVRRDVRWRTSFKRCYVSWQWNGNSSAGSGKGGPQRGGESRLSCSSPHNKTTLRSASSSFPFLLFTQFHCTVRPHAFAPSFAFTLLFRGSVFAGKTAVSAIGRRRSMAIS